MGMTKIIATPNVARARTAARSGTRGIALYHSAGTNFAGLGRYLPTQVRWLPRPPSIRAWDFLSIALAVFGADRFVPRKSTADGWTRMMALDIEVVEPEIWASQSESLAAVLRFLTGDIWHLSFSAGGKAPPAFEPKLSDRGCACLFSGGLDSFIGAADLVAAGGRPILVSQASPKEGTVQKYLANRLGLEEERFAGRVIERAPWPYEPSTRGRSILFFAYGILVATTLPPANIRPRLYVPENGLISVNPPLTRRRFGSLSTRTTHPHFMTSLQKILDAVDVGVELITPYFNKTKGEMLVECRNRQAMRIAYASYSCGKGKRINMHCGRCLPCIIRRAAFFRAGLRDSTEYAYEDLVEHGTFDDVFAVRMATTQIVQGQMARLAGESGPLPSELEARSECVDVVERGLSEVRTFLNTFAWP